MIDGLLVVFGAREQVRAELLFYRRVAQSFPVFCVLNRIDEANTREDLEKNVAYFRKIVSAFSPDFSTVSGYLGLRGRQWKHQLHRFQARRDTEKGLRIYDNPDEVLTESNLLEFEESLKAWLTLRGNRQLWRGMRLARQGIEHVQEQTRLALEETRGVNEREASAIGRQIAEFSRQERLLKFAMHDAENLFVKTAEQSWRAIETGVIARGMENVRETMHNFITRSWATELKTSFFAKANATWKAALTLAQEALAEQAKQINRQLSEKVKQDCEYTCSFPLFSVTLTADLRTPWSGSLNLTPPPPAILRHIEALDVFMLVAGILQAAFFPWEEARGLRKRLQQTFDQKLASCSETLKLAMRHAWMTWETTVKTRILYTYQSTLSQLEQQRAALELSLHSAGERIEQKEKYARGIYHQSEHFRIRLEELERALAEITENLQP